MQTLSLPTHRRRVSPNRLPEAPSCNVDYRQHQRTVQRSLSYMEKLLGEG
ncbi:MAG: hypothetical protein HC812_06435 [Leptolyngbya sp. RL_3_1]|nr:hypothetical protein [Leptolyngbya sp. RL_3_1]